MRGPFSRCRRRPSVRRRALWFQAEPLERRALLASTFFSASLHRDLVFDDTRDVLYVTTSGGSVLRYSVASKSLLPSWQVGGQLWGADITPDGAALYVADGTAVGSQAILRKVALADGSVTGVNYARAAGEGGGWDVALFANGKGLVTSQSVPTAVSRVPFRQIDLATDAVSLREDNPGFVAGRLDGATPLYRSADRSAGLAAEGNGFLFGYRAASDTFGAVRLTDGPLANSVAAVSRDGSLVAIEPPGPTPGPLRILDRNLASVRTLPGIDGGVIFDRGRDLLYGVNSTLDQVIIYNTNTWAEVGRATVGQNVPPSTTFGDGVMATSGDGRVLFLGVPNGVRVLDLGVAAEAGGPYRVGEGNSVRLAGSASAAFGATVASYEWDFDYDGVTFNADATGPTPTFRADGIDGPAARTVALRVTDSLGAVATDTATIQVDNRGPAVSVQGAASARAGEPYTITFSATDPGGDATGDWLVDWGDGTAPETFDAPTASARHTFADGTHVYQVNVQTKDDEGSGGGESLAVVVSGVNDAPVIRNPAPPPQELVEGQQFDLPLAFDDPDTADAHTVTIDWGDGSGETVAELPPGQLSYLASHLYLDDYPSGTPVDVIPIRVSISDGTAAAAAEYSVTVRNDPPTGTFGESRSVAEGSPATFRASFLDRSARDVLTYRWGVAAADGTALAEGSGETFTYTPPDDGLYRVTLLVTDDDGGTWSAFVGLNATNVAPTLVFDGPASVDGGTTYTWNLSATDPGRDTIQSWSVSWGDGTVDHVQGAAASLQHVFPDRDYVRPVQVGARDEDGGYQQFMTVTVRGSNDPPVINDSDVQPGLQYIQEGMQATVYGLFSDPNNGDAHTVTIDWGDGSAPTVLPKAVGEQQFLAGHVYADDNPTGTPSDTMVVRVTVSDGLASDSATTSVVVTNVAPAWYLPSAITMYEGGQFRLPAFIADPGADTLTYRWHVTSDNGQVVPDSAADARDFAFTPDDDGTYTVSLRVSDDDGGVTSETFAVTVLNRPPELTVTYPPTVDEGSPLVVNLSSRDDGDDRLSLWSIEWGDGSAQTVAGDTRSVSHTYPNGRRDVRLRVLATDEDGTYAAGEGGGDGAPDPAFGSGGVVRGPVYSLARFYPQAAIDDMVLLPDGRAVVLGRAWMGPGADYARFLMRLTPNGAGDTTFYGNGTYVMNPSRTLHLGALALAPSGMLVAAGGDTGPGGGVAVARFAANGSLDRLRIGPAGNMYFANDVAVLPDGRIVAGGLSLNSQFSLARFDAQGSPDPTFGTGGSVETNFGDPNSQVTDLALTPDGKIVALGWTGDFGTFRRSWVVARYNPDGTPDTSFNGSGRVVFAATFGQSSLADVVVLPDGKILVGGTVDGPNDNGAFTLARLRPDGTLDTTFGGRGTGFATPGHFSQDANARATSLAVGPDGSIVLAGTAYNTDRGYTAFPDLAVARFTPDGRSDPLFGVAGKQLVYAQYTNSEESANAVAVTADGKVLAAGTVVEHDSRFADVSNLLVVRLGNGGLPVAVLDVPPILSATGPAAAEPGVPYTLNLSVIDPGDETRSWAVDWGDGSPAEAVAGGNVAVTHVYGDGRSRYVITATMNDGEQTRPAAPLTVAVSGVNDAPTLHDLTSPEATTEGAPFVVTGRVEDPDNADAHAVTVAWGDGSADTVLALDPGVLTFTAAHAYADDNPTATPEDAYVITVSVTDGEASVADSRQVLVRNAQPAPGLGPDRTSDEGAPVTLSATIADGGAAPRDVYSYAWRVTADGGAVVAEGAAPTLVFTPADNGVYTVTLVVTDDDGGAGSDTMLLSVANVAPALAATAPATVTRGAPYVVSFSATDPGRDTITSWTVAWGDGAAETLPGTAASASHTYADAPRTFHVIVTATDEDGTYSATPPAGSLDPAFGTGGKVTGGLAYDMAVQRDGKFVTVWGGDPDYNFPGRVSRFNPDGTPDETFGASGVVQLPVLNGRAPGTTSVTIQADDRIVVAGYYWDPQGIHPALFRFNPDGTPDATFGAGGSVYTGWGLDYGNEFWDVVVLPNGKILAGGNVTDSRTSATVHNFFAARFNPDGTPDLSFGAAGRTLGVDFGNTFDRARALLVMPDGKVLLGGETSFDRGLGGFWAPSVFALARFTADGRLDTGFGPPAGGGGKLTTPVPGRDYTSARIKDLLLQPDGSVLAVGSAEKRSGDGDFAVARFRPDFTLDPSFDGDGFALADFGGYDEGFAGALQGDGSVVVAGVTRRGAGATRNSFALARFGPSGALDPTFGAGGKVTTPFEGPGAIASGPAQAVTLLPDGGILAAGYGGVARYARGGMRVTVVEPGPSVAGRHVFYNHSAFDGDDAAANAGDDAAIAAGKSALLPGPGAPSSFANATSYSKGLNGLMVDIAGLPAGPGLTAADFSFRARRADGSWYEYAAPASVSVRRGAGVDGSDRVTLVWPDYNPAAGSPAMALVNAWLEVTVKANANTGLSSPDVFSFGNLAGDTGDSPTSLRVNALDLAALKRGLNSSATLASTIDLNRDGRINALDLAIIKRNLNSTLSLLAAPAAAPQGVALAAPGLFDGDANAPRRPADDLLL